jgi:hypothetical protein
MTTDLLNSLLDNHGIDTAHRGDLDTYDLAPGTVAICPILGNLESEEEGYYSGQTAVAWDAAASDRGPGAGLVDDQDLSTWLHLRWPTPQGQGHGWLADGTFA